MVDEETPARSERSRHATQDCLVLAGREVSEAREEADHGIELRCVAESPHVAAHEPKPRSLAETTPCLVEHRARELQADHMEPAPAELGGVASIATRHVEDPRTPRQTEAPKQKIHLAPGLPGRLLLAQLGGIVSVEEAREPLRRPSRRGAHGRGLRLTNVSG